MSKITIKEIVDLWQETRLGHYKKCQEKHHEFVDLMDKLRKEIYGDEENENII